jgi:hypothetical protein
VVLVPITVVYLAMLPAMSMEQVRRRVLLGFATGLPILGIAVWNATAGRWDAFLVAQGQTGTALSDPLSMLWRLVVTRQAQVQTRPQSSTLAWWVSAETVVVTLMVVAAVVVAVAAWRRRGSVDRNEALVLATVVGIWLVNLSSNALAAPYRGVFALLPVVILLRHVKVPVLWAVAAACVFVTWGISAYFFVPTLLPGGLV